MYTIAFLSDLHLTPEREPAHNTDTWKNFELVLNHSLNGSPDLIVLCGDLCYRDGNQTTYRHIQKIMDTTGIPWLTIAGNHDDPKLMASVFNRETFGPGYFTRQAGPVLLAFLDTSSTGLPRDQVHKLAQTCSNEQKPVVVMHHPPVKGGACYMDKKYPLGNLHSVQQELDELGITTIFSGHHHLGKIIQNNNIQVIFVPSTWYQMNATTATFTPGEPVAGYCMAEFSETGNLVGVIYQYLAGTFSG